MPNITLSDGEVQAVLQALYVAASTNQKTYGATRHMFLARVHEAQDKQGEVPHQVIDPNTPEAKLEATAYWEHRNSIKRCTNPRCVDAACEVHFHTRIDIPYPNEKRFT